MVNKRGVPIGPTWLTRTLENDTHDNDDNEMIKITRTKGNARKRANFESD